MGQPMAGRLVAAGYHVIGYDIAGTDGRLPEGVNRAATIAELATQADIICLSVPDGAASLDVCTQIASTTERRTQTVIDLSTIGIAAARACAATLDAENVTYIDAPVSGGVAGARAGSLAMMVGAPAASFASVEPILAVFASQRFRVGDAAGQGQAMKLLNNYVSAAALAATCEATVFGARLGLDLPMMVDVLNASSGRSAASQDKFPRSVVPRTYDFGFSAALMTKDVTLYLESAQSADVPHDAAAAIAALWQRFTALNPAADFTALHRFLEESNAALRAEQPL